MDWMEKFFQGWLGIVRTLVVGFLAYLCLVSFLRISGKRTLAKLNAFDLVVTVALGSILSSILIQQSVPLAEGVTALALLIGLPVPGHRYLGPVGGLRPECTIVPVAAGPEGGVLQGYDAPGEGHRAGGPERRPGQRRVRDRKRRGSIPGE